MTIGDPQKSKIIRFKIFVMERSFVVDAKNDTYIDTFLSLKDRVT